MSGKTPDGAADLRVAEYLSMGSPGVFCYSLLLYDTLLYSHSIVPGGFDVTS